MNNQIPQPKVMSAINKTWKKATRKKICMHPEAPTNCSKDFGRAHSVQRSKLKRIAENGKVLQVATNSMTGSLSIKSVGIKSASTFYGFCNSHDDKLFAPIEKYSLKVNRENALLLAFRAMSIHMNAKRRHNETDFLNTVPNHLITSDLKRNEEMIRLGVNRLLHFAEHTFDQMSKAILQRQFSNAYYYALVLDRVPDVLSSEASIVNYGFGGSLVREKPQPYDFLTLSLLPYRQGSGIAIFAWHGKSKTNENFLRSLMSLGKREVPNAIVRFIFCQLKNFYFAPNWWKHLSEKKKSCLMNKAVNWTMIPNLAADGNNYIDWKVIDVRSSFKL